jgi:hypothetical protein
MTGMPEAVLARELGVPYAALNLIANYAAGRADSKDGISFEAIEGVLRESMQRVRLIIDRRGEICRPARARCRADHFAVVVAIADVEQHEAVQRVAVTRGVDLGVDDVVAGAGEEADHAGEQIALVARVDHHLEAVALG